MYIAITNFVIFLAENQLKNYIDIGDRMCTVSKGRLLSYYTVTQALVTMASSIP